MESREPKPKPKSWKPKSRDFHWTVPSWVPWLSGVWRGANTTMQQSDWHAMLLRWLTLGCSGCGERVVKTLGYWVVNNGVISSAPNAMLGCFIRWLQAKRMKSQCLLYLILEQKSKAKRMKSQCLLYLILEQKSNAFWVVQAIDSGLVIINVSRKKTSMIIT